MAFRPIEYCGGGGASYVEVVVKNEKKKEKNKKVEEDGWQWGWIGVVELSGGVGGSVGVRFWREVYSRFGVLLVRLAVPFFGPSLPLFC